MRLKFKFSIYRKNLSLYKKYIVLRLYIYIFSASKTHQRLCHYQRVLQHGHEIISEERKKKFPLFSRSLNNAKHLFHACNGIKSRKYASSLQLSSAFYTLPQYYVHETLNFYVGYGRLIRF